jgi:hypothetical protein
MADRRHVGMPGLNGKDQVAMGKGTIANEEAMKTSRMARLTKVMTTKGTFSRRNM